MISKRHHARDIGPTRAHSRQDLRSCRWWCVAVLWLLAAACGPFLPTRALAQDEPAPLENPSPGLTLAEVHLQGATRTPLATVYRYLGLEPGQAVTQQKLIQAMADLEQGHLFRSVSYYTRPGAQRGQLVLVLEVQEHAVDFRWAAGNTDLDGWYLVPVMVAYDNPWGRGGQLDLQMRFGFRHTGLLLRYGQSRAGDGRTYWGARLASLDTDRPYFYEGVEFQHHVWSAGAAGVLGRRINDHRLVELGLRLEGVDAEDHATAHLGSEDGTIGEGEEIPADRLPEVIRKDLGYSNRAVVHLDWQFDYRSTRLRAGTPVSGVWGRIKGTYTLQNAHNHPGVQADLRAFREVPGGVLAGRMRAAWVGSKAAFYDRLYLGGLYSVRGFPTHSLTKPGGDTWQWSASLEYRSRILADGRGGTRLAGVLFCDLGAGGQENAQDPYPGLAVGAGYGVRWKVWWLDWIGLDLGFPLTDRPLDMNFQATASIGWSF